jgi:hypothetical protein
MRPERAIGGLGACVQRAPLLALALVLACVDPDGRYDAFVERSAAMRGRDAGTGQPEPGERFDFGGSYLLALSTTLAPGQPILLGCEVSVASDLETLELTFQALTTDEADPPRAPTGEPFTIADVVYEQDGSFSADLGEVTVPSDANPISGSEIIATVAFSARAVPMSDELPQLFCGQASGMVSVPLMLDLAGSTIGAVETQGSDVTDVEPLPRCPGG